VKLKGLFVSTLVLSIFVASSEINAGELSGNISLEGRYFNSDGAFTGQQEKGCMPPDCQVLLRALTTPTARQRSVRFVRSENTNPLHDQSNPLA